MRGIKLDWIDAVSRRAPPFYVPVGVQIVQHMNKRTRRARPAQERLAARTRLSVATVKRAVKWYEDGGWLRVTRRRVYETGKWKTRNFYWLRMDNVAAVLAEEVAVSSISGETQTHLKKVHIDYRTNEEINVTVASNTTASKYRFKRECRLARAKARAE